MLESKLQSKIIAKLKKEGHIVCKIHNGLVYNKRGDMYSLGNKGFPDIFVISKNKLTLIEFKMEGKLLSLDQVVSHLNLNEKGFLPRIITQTNYSLPEENCFTLLNSKNKNSRKYKFVAKKDTIIIDDYIKEKDA